MKYETPVYQKPINKYVILVSAVSLHNNKAISHTFYIASSLYATTLLQLTNHIDFSASIILVAIQQLCMY